jgi:L-fuconolactonase
MIIDSHQHFWKYNSVRHSWIGEDMAVLKNDFMPADLEPLLKSNRVDACVAVQAEESGEENNFLLQLAEENNFIKAVIGWIDMLAENIESTLQQYKAFEKIKGFRYVLQDKPKRDLMLSPLFKKNLSCLDEYGFTYDILILKDQLIFADELVKQVPRQKFVIDHLAKPAVKLKEQKEWKKEITAIAKNENVYCKLSGLVTEADWKNFSQNDFIPYVETVLEVFGNKRLMYGSDWPVCLLAASYNTTFNLAKQFISALSLHEQNDIMGNNTVSFYNL